MDIAQVRVMSALTPEADVAERDRHVRFVPEADMRLLEWASSGGQGQVIRRYFCFGWR